MSLTRGTYDSCVEYETLDQNRGMLDYVTRPPINIAGCLPSSPLIISQGGADGISAGPRVPFKGPVDTESDLLNIGRKATKCQSAKYMPFCDGCGTVNAEIAAEGGFCRVCNKTLGKLDQIQVGSCDFGVDCTRETNPAANLRGVTIDRFDPLCANPQAQGIFFPGQWSVDTRMVAKDTFRPCIPTPAINPMTPPVLPNARFKNMRMQ